MDDHADSALIAVCGCSKDSKLPSTKFDALLWRNRAAAGVAADAVQWSSYTVDHSQSIAGELKLIDLQLLKLSKLANIRQQLQSL
jgi:hypothetical protein